MGPDISPLSRVNDWIWQKEYFEELFGRRKVGDFQQLWPKDVRVAVALTFDTQGDVDAAVKGYQESCLWPGGEINYCDLTMRQYGLLDGVDRILRILAKYEIKGTFPTCGLTARWYPDVIKDVAERGHEIAAHGFYHILMHELTDEEQRREIETTTEAITEVVGTRPVGWRSPVYSITPATLRILRETDYQWNSDFHNADFPYVLDDDGHSIVEIPAGVDDWTTYLSPARQSPKMGGTPYGTADGVFSTLKAEFDMLYEESAEGPRMFQFCMHPKISGRPFRAKVLQDLIEHILEHDGVRFVTMSELADLAGTH